MAHNLGVAHPLSRNHLDVPYYNLTQCQFCYSNQGKGVKLKKCAGCKIYMYCSVLCQKKAWKATHKGECVYINSGFDTELNQPSHNDRTELHFAAMRAFSATHEATITNVALEALDVIRNPERCYRDVLLINLKLNPKPTVVGRLFVVIEARVCSAEELGSMKLLGQLKSIVQTTIGPGGETATHAVGVILRNTVWMIDHISPVMFSINRPSSPIAGFDWERELMENLNEGSIVV